MIDRVFHVTYYYCTMAKQSVNVTLNGEDVRLIMALKKTLLATHGKVSSTAVIRIALRRMAQEQK